MPEFRYRYIENAPGRFYTDILCLDCTICRDTAPDIFHRSDVHNTAFVVRQPQTPAEVEACEECVYRCPCQAIGDDGHDHDWSQPPEPATRESVEERRKRKSL